MTEMLPATTPEYGAPIHWELIWPGHARVDVWLQGVPSPDLVFDRHQVAQLLGFPLEGDLAEAVPAEWWVPHDAREEQGGPRLVELWSRETVLHACRILAEPASVGEEFASWIDEHQRVLVRDFEGLVASSTPALAGGFGRGFEVADLARRLTGRYGHVPRELLFSRMVALGWVELVPGQSEHGRYRPTQQGLSEHLVFVRPTRLPGKRGIYQQVLVTAGGFALLETDIAALVDVDQMDEALEGVS